MGDTIGYAWQRELLATQLQAQMTNGRKSFWPSRKPCLKKRQLPTALPPRTYSCKRTPNIAGFCMFSSKNLRILLEVFGFMIRSDCSGFRRGNPPTDPKASGSVGNNPPLTIRVVSSGGFWFEFWRVARVGRVSGFGGQS